MTTEEIEQFRMDFKKIGYQKGLLSDALGKVAKLTRYDKNDSHKAAILKAIEEKSAIGLKLTEMLRGRDYSEWVILSKRLSVLTSRLKNAIAQKERTEYDLNHLQF